MVRIGNGKIVYGLPEDGIVGAAGEVRFGLAGTSNAPEAKAELLARTQSANRKPKPRLLGRPCEIPVAGCLLHLMPVAQ